jgi:hypothetical protein
MYCKECGKLIEDDSKFCRYCGTNVEFKLDASSKKILKEASIENSFKEKAIPVKAPLIESYLKEVKDDTIKIELWTRNGGQELCFNLEVSNSMTRKALLDMLTNLEAFPFNVEVYNISIIKTTNKKEKLYLTIPINGPRLISNNTPIPEDFFDTESRYDLVYDVYSRPSRPSSSPYDVVCLYGCPFSNKKKTQ